MSRTAARLDEETGEPVVLDGREVRRGDILVDGATGFWAVVLATNWPESGRVTVRYRGEVWDARARDLEGVFTPR